MGRADVLAALLSLAAFLANAGAADRLAAAASAPAEKEGNSLTTHLDLAQRSVPGHRGAAEAPGVGRVVASVLPSVGLVAGAVLAKETALSLPALLVAWDFCAVARLR